MVRCAEGLDTQEQMRILKLEGGETILDCGVSTLTKYFCCMEKWVLGNTGDSLGFVVISEHVLL